MQTFWRMNDTAFPAECTATPIYVAEKLQGALLTFRDTSERTEIERMKSEFVSIVSHELRTPLTSVRGVLGLLASGKLAELGPKATQMVHLAERNAEKLTELITSIVDVERLESGRLKLHQVYTSSPELVKVINEAAHPLGEEGGVTLSYKVDNMPLEIDVERVTQVIINLISNAVKFSERGQTVIISIMQEHQAVHFSVADQGPGIPAEKQAKVFDRFQQGDSSDVRGKGGTGLGLTIARGLVQRHGGRIWVESEEGHGSVFHFTLPQRRKRIEEQPLPLGLS
jgi:signal transduction histidine kinase